MTPVLEIKDRDLMYTVMLDLSTELFTIHRYRIIKWKMMPKILEYQGKKIDAYVLKSFSELIPDFSPEEAFETYKDLKMIKRK